MSLQPDTREQAVRDRIEWSQVAGRGAAVLWSTHEVAHLLRTIDGLRADAVQPGSIGEAARLILDRVKSESRYLEPNARTALEALAALP